MNFDTQLKIGISAVALVGAALVGVGVYSLLHKDDVAAAPSTTTAVAASTPAGTQVIVQGTDRWKDSGVRVKRGQIIKVNATGSVVWDQDLPAVNPNGTHAAATVERPSDFPMPEAGCGSLIMRIGEKMYAVGAGDTVVAPSDGPVLFMINDRYMSLGNNSGSFTVNVSAVDEQPASQQITVDARRVWTDTGIKVKQGDQLTISATGQINVAGAGDGANKWVGPDGWGYIPPLYCGNSPCRYKYAVPNSLGSLIGRVGSGQVFPVGPRATITAPSSGMLYLGVNDSISDHLGNSLNESEAAAQMYSNNQGNFTATVSVGRK